MLEYERRMPKIEKIPQITATKVDIDKLNKVILDQDSVTVIRLRHAKLTFSNFDEITLAAMKRELPNDTRTKEIIENIGKVESANRYDVLFDFLSIKIGNDAISPLIKKLRNKNKDLYRDVLAKLTGDYTNTFMDSAILILCSEYDHQDISDEIIGMLKTNKIRDPLDFSSLLMILGRSKDARYINFLYTFYVFFKDNFPEAEYYEGPFLGINEIIDRLEF